MNFHWYHINLSRQTCHDLRGFTHIHYPQSCGSVRIIAVKWESRQSIPQSFANCQYAYILIDSYSDTIKPTSNDLQPIYCIIISDLIMSFAVIHCLFFKHFFFALNRMLWFKSSLECLWEWKKELEKYFQTKGCWKSGRSQLRNIKCH